MNNFAENLKKIRKDNNLSQEQLAESLGVSRQAISKWESSVAYPEMDKIIALCDKFNLNIDDLLHKDIREVKGEEESKKNINKYIDDFLNFITDTINLFSNMSFKSKIKCLFEQFIIIFILWILAIILYGLGSYIISTLLSFLPIGIYNIIISILKCIYTVFAVITGIIILVHIFKTRYLDYFDKIKSNKEDKKTESFEDKHETLFKKNENKIIIRDPKHSEYKFVHGLFKLIIGVIKFFALCFSVFLCFTLIGLFCLFALSFLVIKTGVFFIGIASAILSSCVIDIIFLLIIFNFVFNRQNDKKKMIWSFIISLIIFGISLGFIFIGSLNFNVAEDKDMFITKTKEFPMKEDLFFNTYYEINYVESDISNVKMEYKTNKLCQSNITSDDKHGINVWGYCSNPTKLARTFIKNINHKKLIYIDNEIKDVVVYASKENIDIIKNNKIKYDEDNKQYENRINSYEEQIKQYQNQIDNDNVKLEEYQNKINDLEEQIRNSKEEQE